MSLRIYHGTHKGTRAFVAAGSRSEAAKLGLTPTTDGAPLTLQEQSLALAWARVLFVSATSGKYERAAR